MNIHTLYRSFLTHFRKRRLTLVYRLFGIDTTTRVLDVGGGWFFWNLAAGEGLPTPSVTVVNLLPPEEEPIPGGRWMIADARSLPFASQSFDLAFSNSVIEHLSNWKSQAEFAKEIRRVARSYVVQTPNRAFPVEPHLITPFIHWLPERWRRRLLRSFTVWGWITRPSPAQCEQFLHEVRLLTRTEMARLFPESTVITERALGLPKSLLAVHTAAENPTEAS